MKEWERILGRMGGNAATYREGCLEEWERILGGIRGTAATYWEGYFGSSGELLRQIGRIPGNIENVFIIIIGELVAAKRRDAATYREGCCDKWGESLGTMGIYSTE